MLYLKLIEGINLMHFPNPFILARRLHSYINNFLNTLTNGNKYEIFLSSLNQKNPTSDNKNYSDEELLSIKTNHNIKSAECLCLKNEQQLDLSDLNKIKEAFQRLNLNEEYQFFLKILYGKKKSSKEKYYSNFYKGSLKFVIESVGRNKWTF